MGVHYDRGLIGRVKAMKLRPVTLAIGGELVFQGGCTQKRQIQLMQLMGELQEEYEAAIAQQPEPTTEPEPEVTNPADIPAPETTPIVPEESPNGTPHPRGRRRQSA